MNKEINLDSYFTPYESVSHSVVSDSLWPHGLQPARLLCPWDSPGKKSGVGCHSLLQGIFPTQELNQGLLHCRQILYWLRQQGSPNTYSLGYVFANTWHTQIFKISVNLMVWRVLICVMYIQRSNCQHLLDHRTSKKVPEKYLLLLYWLCQSFWLCGSQQTLENS